MDSPPTSSAADPTRLIDGHLSPSPKGGESWPDTDHPTLTSLRDGSAAEKEEALRRLFITYSHPLRRYIRRHWPLLSESLSALMIFCSKWISWMPRLHSKKPVRAFWR